jgi:hypothetical protein
MPCTPGQELIHNVNGIFKAQKSENIFERALGVGEGGSHITKIYSDGKKIFGDANRFMAHHRSLAHHGP